jgi:prevent-host-death family protein
METVNMHEAKTRLSQLVAKGEPFVIAKAGRPVARVTAIDAPEPSKFRRLGFMKGHLSVPEDFDRMGEAEIAALFGSDS